MRPPLLPLLFPVLLALLTGCGTTEQPAAPGLPPPAPTIAEVTERGRYLVEVMGCHDCHSPKVMGPTGPMLDTTRLLSGHPADAPLPPADPTANPGWVLMGMDLTTAIGPWGTSFSANLTSDASGIGDWTEEQFKRAITQGLYKGIEGSRPLLPPMPWQNLVNLKDEDVHAIFTYLQSTKPVQNVVPPPVPPAAR